MNKTAILHIPNSQYAFAYKKDELRLRFRTAKSDVQAVTVIYAVKYDWLTERKTAKMIKSFSDGLFDYFTVSLFVPDSRIGYIFTLTSDGKEFYYSENGITENYDHSKGYYNFFQFPYINYTDLMEEVSYSKDAVVYQIFVERFLQGDTQKDCGYINQKWSDKPTSTSFFGGDINGITQKLNYLQSLGINCIYLTPIFTSPSNHKYDTIDYLNVDIAFGGNGALKELVEKAHEKGIRIFLDAVFNHCSDKFMYFQDVKKHGEKSKYAEWFIKKSTITKGGEFECFAYCDYMPKLNTNNAEVQDYLINVAIKWIEEYDIDGWRLDVSDEVAHYFWKKFRRAIKDAKADAIIIGENWHDARPWLVGDEYDSIMNYSFTKACLDFFAFETFNAKQFAERLAEILMRNTDQVNNMMLNILDTHDTERFLHNTNGNKNKLKMALAVMFFFVGMPCVYYGTEIGTMGGYDPDSRRTFNWDETTWDVDLLSSIKELIRIKKEKISGDIMIIEQDGLFIIKREKLTLVVNNTKKAKVYEFDGNKNTIQSESYLIIE